MLTPLQGAQVQSVTTVNELILELSHNCDLACVMCGFGGGKVSPEKFMTVETVGRVLEAVHPAPRVVRLNGRGESTIHPRFVEILQLVRGRYPDVQINLFSHLSMTATRVMDALIENDVQMFVSMDSPDPERFAAIRKRGRYSSVVANLDRLRNAARRPFIIFTLQESNFDDVVAMARFCVERRLHFLVNTVRRDEGIEPFQQLVHERRDDLQRYFEEVNVIFSQQGVACYLPDRIQGVQTKSAGTQATYGGRQRCPAIDRELCVLFDGTVTPCNMFNPYVYGNILTESLAEIRAGGRFQWFTENHKSHPYCSNCACLGGTA